MILRRHRRSRSPSGWWIGVYRGAGEPLVYLGEALAAPAGMHDRDTGGQAAIVGHLECVVGGMGHVHLNNQLHQLFVVELPGGSGPLAGA